MLTCLLCWRLLQALAASPLPPSRRIQIGSKLTRGLGAGGNPGVGLVGWAGLFFRSAALVLSVGFRFDMTNLRSSMWSHGAILLLPHASGINP